MNTIGRPCIVCGARTNGTGRCPAHPGRTEAERVKAQPWRLGYRDPAYHRERQAAKTRAAGRCEQCGGMCIDCELQLAQQCPHLECDHIIELSRGGTNIRDNMIMLCPLHHQAKTKSRRRKQ
ncbi:MAG: HNH endonuclease signature motif containing protein [Candidatus Nanopelagicales bacterium]